MKAKEVKIIINLFWNLISTVILNQPMETHSNQLLS